MRAPLTLAVAAHLLSACAETRPATVGVTSGNPADKAAVTESLNTWAICLRQGIDRFEPLGEPVAETGDLAASTCLRQESNFEETAKRYYTNPDIWLSYVDKTKDALRGTLYQWIAEARSVRLGGY